jgi:hypothetical protein
MFLKCKNRANTDIHMASPIGALFALASVCIFFGSRFFKVLVICSELR